MYLSVVTKASNLFSVAYFKPVVPVVSLIDVQQSVIGSCSLEDVAVRVLTRVIGHCPHRNQLLIDCGWTGLR